MNGGLELFGPVIATPTRPGRSRPPSRVPRPLSFGMGSFDDFQRLDVRVGTVVDVEDFPRARTPAYRLTVDFGGEIGERRTSAQVTTYDREELRGMQVVAVVNFEPKNIAGFMSEVLVLGVPGPDGEVVLLTPTRQGPDGGRMY